MDFGASGGVSSSEIVIGDFDEASPSAESIGERSFFHQSVEIVTQRTWTKYFHGIRARLPGMRQISTSANSVWPDGLSFAANSKGTKTNTNFSKTQITTARTNNTEAGIVSVQDNMSQERIIQSPAPAAIADGHDIEAAIPQPHPGTLVDRKLGIHSPQVEQPEPTWNYKRLYRSSLD